MLTNSICAGTFLFSTHIFLFFCTYYILQRKVIDNNQVKKLISKYKLIQFKWKPITTNLLLFYNINYVNSLYPLWSSVSFKMYYCT